MSYTNHHAYRLLPCGTHLQPGTPFRLPLRYRYTPCLNFGSVPCKEPWFSDKEPFSSTSSKPDDCRERPQRQSTAIACNPVPCIRLHRLHLCGAPSVPGSATLSSPLRRSSRVLMALHAGGARHRAQRNKTVSAVLCNVRHCQLWWSCR